MNKRIGILVGCGLLGALTLAGCFALAQRPGGGYNNGQVGDDTVTRMMEFDANKDGKLTRQEVTDERLTRLFDHADANKDGTVTPAELTALVAAEPARRGGPGGFGPPGGGPPGGGFRPGVVLPPMVQARLNLSAEQKTQVESLQKEVDAGLEKIFNEEQKARWKAMRSRGPGGPPGGRGPGGRRGPGGPGGGGPGPGGPDGGPPDRAP